MRVMLMFSTLLEFSSVNRGVFYRVRRTLWSPTVEVIALYNDNVSGMYIPAAREIESLQNHGKFHEALKFMALFDGKRHVYNRAN
jgi:hypothetical protein